MFNQHLLQHKMTSCTTCQLGRAFHGQSFNYSNQAKPREKMKHASRSSSLTEIELKGMKVS
jgi:hypothetical protein